MEGNVPNIPERPASVAARSGVRSMLLLGPFSIALEELLKRTAFLFKIFPLEGIAVAIRPVVRETHAEVASNRRLKAVRPSSIRKRKIDRSWAKIVCCKLVFGA